VALLLLLPLVASAQITSGDCLGAIPVCGNNVTLTAPPSGVGGVRGEINPTISCLSRGDTNGVWYRLTPAANGNLEFTITSTLVVGVDVNWALFNVSSFPDPADACQAIRNTPALQTSCNNCVGFGANTTTGASPAGVGNITPNAPGCNTFNTTVPVNAGQTYLLFVSNNGTAAPGYTIAFSGVSLADTEPPSITDIIVDRRCNQDTLIVRFSEPVSCASIQKTDFRLTGPGSVVLSIDTVFTRGCAANGTVNQVTLRFNPALRVNGTYTVALINAIADACGNVQGGPFSLSFVLDNTPQLDTLVDPVSCGKDSIVFAFNRKLPCNIVGRNIFRVTGPGGPYTVVAVTGATCTSGTGLDSVFTLRVTPRIVQSGTYTLRMVGPLTDTCGNRVTPSELTFTISNPLTASAGPDASLCAGEPGVLLQGSGAGAPGLVYLWTPATGLDNPNIANPIATPSQTTNYTLTVRNGNCVSPPDFVRVTVIQKSRPVITGQTTVCRGSSTTLTATGAQQYVWLPGNILGQSITVTPLQNSTYSVVGLVDGCLGDTVSIQVNVRLLPTASFVAPTVVCAQDTYTVIADQPDISNNYDWDFGKAQVISGSGPGPYQLRWNFAGNDVINLRVTDTAGCTATTFQQLQIRPKALIEAGPDITLCGTRDSAVLAAVSNTPGTCTYQWTPTLGLSNPNALNPVAKPLVTTTYILTANCGGCDAKPDTLVVRVVPRPTAFINTNFIDQCFGSPNQLPGGGFGGTGTLSYSWTPIQGLDNPFSPTPNANPGDTTRYRLVVTDANGCQSDPAFVDLRVSPNPVANAGPDLSFCQGQPGVTLQPNLGNVPGRYQVQWSPATGLTDPTVANPFAQPDTTTIYQLTLTDLVTGCTSTPTGLDTLSTVTVRVLTRPVADAGPNRTICYGDTTDLGGLPSGGITYTYLWTPATGLDNPNVLSPKASPRFTTTYFLVVDNGQCASVADSVTVTVLQRPSVTVDPPLVRVCPQDSVQLNAIINLPQPYFIEWFPATDLSNPNIPNPLASPAATRTYYLRVAANGCPALTIDSVVVSVEPLPAFQADSTQSPTGLRICQGDSLRLPARVLSTEPLQYQLQYQWTPATGLSDPTALRPLARPTETTKYFLTLIRGNCTAVDSVIVEVLPGLQANITADTNLTCQGTPIILTAEGGRGSVTYQWSPATGLNSSIQRQVLAAPLQTTTYTVVMRENGCESIDTFTVHVQPQPQAAFSQTSATGCGQLRVSFLDRSAQAAGWQWNFGDGSPVVNTQNPVHVYTQPGTYTVRLVVQGPGGCVDSIDAATDVIVGTGITAQIAQYPDTLTLPNADIFFQDSSQNGPAVYYQWQFGDGGSALVANPAHRYTRVGVYTPLLIVRDANGCADTTLGPPIFVLPPRLDIPNVFTPNGDGIHDTWNLQYDGNEPFHLMIDDRWGAPVWHTTDPTARWNGQTEGGADLPDGVYFYWLTIGDKAYKGTVTLLR